jgi:transposase
VKQVWRDDRRYIVCFNPDEADKDRHDRETIVAALEKALAQGDKSLVGNKGFRRFLRTQGTRFAIDDATIVADAQYDGKWVLRTNTGLAMDVAALAYKHLFMVEAIFRSMKSLLETRPIYHQKDETIRGHVFCSFLALVLRQELERRLAQQEATFEWADIVRDLDHLQATTITVNEKDYVIRSQIKGTLGKVFQATGVAIPPAVRPA